MQGRGFGRPVHATQGEASGLRLQSGSKVWFLVYLLGWWGPRGDCKGLVGGDTWGRGREGRDVVLDGGLTPGLPSKRKWDHAGGPDPIKGIHGQMDGQSDTKPASFPPASQP